MAGRSEGLEAVEFLEWQCRREEGMQQLDAELAKQGIARRGQAIIIIVSRRWLEWRGLVLREYGFTSWQVFSSIIFDPGLLIYFLVLYVFMAARFLSENPNFIVGPNSLVTGNHTAYDSGPWGVDFIGNLWKPQFYRGCMWIISIPLVVPYFFIPGTPVT